MQGGWGKATDLLEEDCRAAEEENFSSPFFVGLKPTGEVGNQAMRRMLIVDDESDICELLKDFFSAKGFAVCSAFSGEEALDILANGSADVILLDILLPGLSGIEVLKYAKELHPYARIIMVTSIDHDDIRNVAQQNGAAAYVTKPFDFSDKTWSAVFDD